MKTIFCANQKKIVDYDRDTIKIFCAFYNKECPYSKSSKAQKKCMEVYFIPERPVTYDQNYQE